jgi:hypothetical protein
MPSLPFTDFGILYFHFHSVLSPCAGVHLSPLKGNIETLFPNKFLFPLPTLRTALEIVIIFASAVKCNSENSREKKAFIFTHTFTFPHSFLFPDIPTFLLLPLPLHLKNLC